MIFGGKFIYNVIVNDMLLCSGDGVFFFLVFLIVLLFVLEFNYLEVKV